MGLYHNMDRELYEISKNQLRNSHINSKNVAKAGGLNNMKLDIVKDKRDTEE